MGRGPTTIQPDNDARDLSLGRFMTAWSGLESNVRFTLRILSGTHAVASFAITAAIPDIGRQHDLLLALGRLSLDEVEMKDLRAECKYLLILNNVRNSIVHARWVQTMHSSHSAETGLVHRFEWLRLYSFIDKEEETAAVLDESDKNFRAYTLGRIDQRTVKVRGLSKRFNEMAKRLRGKYWEDQGPPGLLFRQPTGKLPPNVL